jgi:hypothetical protein
MPVQSGTARIDPLLVAVMIAFVPITFGAPAPLVVIPPLMTFTPASLSGLVQFPAFMIGLPAVTAVVFDGLVQIMLGVRDAPLALFLSLCLGAWYCGDQHK